MATVRILLGIVWLAAIGSGWMPERNLLIYTAPSSRTAGRELLARACVLQVARAEVGVREATGHNDGKRIEAYLAAVNLPEGHPYCAAFLSWVFRQAGYERPRTAWSPSLFPKERLVKNPLPGMVLGIYFPDLKRIAHCALVEHVKGSWVVSIDGNSNADGSREGNGVYRKIRHARTIYRYADWIKKNKKGGMK